MRRSLQTAWQRFVNGWFGQTEPLDMQLTRHALAHAKNVFPLNPPAKTGNPFAYAERMGGRQKEGTAMDQSSRDLSSDAGTADVILTRWPSNPGTGVRVAPGKPTVTELADLLEQLTLGGMPPRGQARHAAWHWPAMVRKEEEPLER